MIARIKMPYLTKVGRTSKIVSLNQYKSLHWRSLKQKIDPIKQHFCLMIQSEKIPPLKWMELRIEHNTNFDLDNLTGTVKIFVDCLRKENVIVEDNKKFWDYLSIRYNPELDKNYLIFEITGECQT